MINNWNQFCTASGIFANEVREGKLEDNVAAVVGWVET